MLEDNKTDLLCVIIKRSFLKKKDFIVAFLRYDFFLRRVFPRKLEFCFSQAKFQQNNKINEKIADAIS